MAIAVTFPSEIHFVFDAQTDDRSDTQLAKSAVVKSLAAIALQDATSRILRVIVIALGDYKADVSEEAKLGLRMLAGATSRWLTSVTQAEELNVAREVDKLAKKALEKTTATEATKEFVTGAPNLRNLDGQVRRFASESQ